MLAVLLYFVVRCVVATFSCVGIVVIAIVVFVGVFVAVVVVGFIVFVVVVYDYYVDIAGMLGWIVVVCFVVLVVVVVVAVVVYLWCCLALLFIQFALLSPLLSVILWLWLLLL